MSKFVITTALALVLAGGAYAAENHRGPGGGGGGGGGGQSMMSHGPSGPSNFSSSMSRGPSGINAMGPTRGPTGNVYNRAPTMNTYNKTNGGNFNKNYNRFTERNHREMYNRYEGNRIEGNRIEGNRVEGGRNLDHRGVVQGNFFEHGRHFRFRRFWHSEWVFLNDWDDCTAFAWVHLAPGVWAWRPIDICIG